MAHINGFYPYLYTEPPQTFTKDECAEFRNILNNRLKAIALENLENSLLKVEYVLKADIYGFSEVVPFLKITFALPGLVSICKKILGGGINIPNHGTHKLSSYDCDIDFVIRFMVDSQIYGCSWVEFRPGRYSIREETRKSSLCQLEVDADWRNIIFHTPDKNWSNMAPIRILSFDVESVRRKGCDSIVQISNMITRFGKTESIIKNIFTLNSCAPITGAHVISDETEEDLLRHWAQFIRQVDPDIVTGYNIQNFDLPYLIDRVRTLNIRGFELLGRIKSVPSKLVELQVGMKQMDSKNNKMVHMTGRVQFDLLLVIFHIFRFGGHGIKYVCVIIAEVIYEENGSVMIKFGVSTVPGAMALGKAAALLISKQFIAPIKLEFGKVYFPYLLINKKRYAGMYYTKFNTYDKMDCKGLGTNRRDNCPLVAKVLNTCLQKLLISRDENGSMKHAQSVIGHLLCDRIYISQLIISKELWKSPDEYTNDQATAHWPLKCVNVTQAVLRNSVIEYHM